VVIVGSGELGPAIVPTLRALADETKPERVVVLDGSYSFQANADQLSEKITEHLARAVNWQAEVVAATSGDRTGEALRIAAADLVFAGPGSPTYALRQWHHPAIVEALVAVLENGGTLVMASAAALTLGARTLPVYEIYKAGEDPYWMDGLDILGRFGIEAAVIPHWNNREGGTHDTSRCFVGQARFAVLEEQLSPDTYIIGVDEHTALTLDLDTGSRQVAGAGTVTIRHARSDPIEAAPLTVAAPGVPMSPDQAPPPTDDLEEWVGAVVAAAADPHRLADLTRQLRQDQEERVQRSLTPLIEILSNLRQRDREADRYDRADEIRRALAELGIALHDGPEGTTWEFTRPLPSP
jgi:hypothetical protein